MSEVIIAALVSAAAAIVVGLINSRAQHNKLIAELDKRDELQAYRIGQLERKVDKEYTLEDAKQDALKAMRNYLDSQDIADDAWRGRIYAVRYFLTFVSSGAAVSASGISAWAASARVCPSRVSTPTVSKDSESG